MTSFQEDTIVAISTPLGEGGIGIIRLSGPDSLALADRIFQGKDGRKPSCMSTHTLHYGHIMAQEVFLDEVLLAVMRAPRTYTREDIVEINCHGGIVPLKKVLELTLQEGARLAEPGEFTKRAFLKGRIDLAQAEAVAETIRAKTDLSLRAAMSQLRGYLSIKVEYIRRNLLNLIAEVEVNIDFPEEDIRILGEEDMGQEVKKLKVGLEELLASADSGKVLREGIKTVIAGKPNVGKSSLWNAFLGEERAIVTPLPGTTRDALEEIVSIQGIPLRLVDTAGIRRARGKIEKESIVRSRRFLEEADLVLIVLDGAEPLTGDDKGIMEEVKGKTAIIVINKIDLSQKIRLGEAKKVWSGKKIVRISATQGTGLPELKKAVADIFWRGGAPPSPETVLVTNARHKEALLRAGEGLEEALIGLERQLSPEFIASNLRSAMKSLGEIGGETANEEILDRIFSQFCIGK
ncbi:tRNA uridine-5-carboxymethylaminomethyl(34) synthesis GTPase MnmE [candidate division NPL-UPA2 bacterium]|nr:tRNA uridine-5-carboxymethylaminomethyl(34) synthesis GTPase MnmE [candidate division NPL-UPA2 bacterium]